MSIQSFINLFDGSFGKITAGAIAIMGYLIRNYYATYRDRRLAKNIPQISQVISQSWHNSGATGAFVFMYHNGGIFYTGACMENMTMIAERSVDMQYDMRDFKNILVSYWGKMYDTLNEKPVLIKNIGSIDPNEFPALFSDRRFRDVCLFHNIYAHYAYPIKKRKIKWKFGGLPIYENVVVASVHFVYDEARQQTVYNGSEYSLTQFEQAVALVKQKIL